MEFNFFRVLPKRVCLSLLQFVVKPALNYCVSSPFAGLLLAWALFERFILLSFSSSHPLFLCCHSRLLSFRIPLLVLIALFLTVVVFLPSKGIIYQSPQLFRFLSLLFWYFLFYHTEIHHLAPPATWRSISLGPLGFPTSVPSALTTGPLIFPADHCLSYFTLHWLHTSLAPAICGKAQRPGFSHPFSLSHPLVVPLTVPVFS